MQHKTKNGEGVPIFPKGSPFYQGKWGPGVPKFLHRYRLLRAKSRSQAILRSRQNAKSDPRDITEPTKFRYVVHANFDLSEIEETMRLQQARKQLETELETALHSFGDACCLYTAVLVSLLHVRKGGSGQVALLHPSIPLGC